MFSFFSRAGGGELICFQLLLFSRVFLLLLLLFCFFCLCVCFVWSVVFVVVFSSISLLFWLFVASLLY